jgi:hypothetical protein
VLYSVETSPLRASIRRPFGRSDPYSLGCASPARLGSCRAERSEVETSPRIRATPIGHAGLRGGFSTPPLLWSGLWSKRPGFYGDCLLPPATGHVERSEAESRPLLDGWRNRSVCCTPWRLLHSGPPRVGPPVEATGILWALLFPSAPGHVERTVRESRPVSRTPSGISSNLPEAILRGADSGPVTPATSSYTARSCRPTRPSENVSRTAAGPC